MILVAGGTGFLGRAIVNALRRDGHVVRILSRGSSPNPFVNDRGVTVATGDVREANTLGEAFDGVDTLVVAVQFPGHPVEVPKKGLTYDEYDRKGTENLVAAAKKAGVQRIVYLSGANVGTGRSEEWFVAKDKAEAAVRGSGIAYTILRPSWVYGPRDKSLNKFATFARTLPFVPMPGSGKTRVQPVHVDDVATAVALSLKLPAAENQVIEIGGPQLLSFRQIVKVMLGVMGRKRPVLPTPVPVVKLGAALLYRLPGHVLSPRAVDFVNGEGAVDNRALHDLLGFHPRSLEDGIAYLRRR
ncbi:MAG TPA: NAD(P)H-binding protein [Mycobacteriales bacterium]|jgi:NADH dehydrogenase|nr:NAD(P)H-binding protein [Mycobacteriales bacterium]